MWGAECRRRVQQNRSGNESAVRSPQCGLEVPATVMVMRNWRKVLIAILLQNPYLCGPGLNPKSQRREAIMPVLLNTASQGLLLNRRICRTNIPGGQWNPSRNVCDESPSREKTECSRGKQKREIIGIPERFEPPNWATTTLH